MQAQYHPVPAAVGLHHHHDPFAFTSQPVYPLHSDQSLASPGEVDFTHSFLGGSSPSYGVPHDDSRYALLYRGEATYRTYPTTTTGGEGIDATCLGFPGPTNSLFPAEEIASYVDPSWNWNQTQAQGSVSVAYGVVAPIPMLPAPPEASFLPLKSKEEGATSIVRSPGPPLPLPTPAAMAVLLSTRTTRSEGQGVYDGSTVSAAGGRMVRGVGTAENTTREKKHACTMCHKRFDRPSTLRKHLLVHTGEKAFVCDICGRRFGVASNLNRHAKRCALKPVNMTAKSSAGEETASSVATSPENSIARSPASSQKRASISSSSSSANSSSSPRGRSSTSPIHATQSATICSNGAKPTKRRRRAPSPSRWVPLSLISFNLASEDFYKSVQVPLPPVRRNLPKEERDSWDENTSPRPYHPDSWQGVLPGPGFHPTQGLKAREVRKYNFGNGGGTTSAFTVGRVLVF